MFHRFLILAIAFVLSVQQALGQLNARVDWATYYASGESNPMALQTDSLGNIYMAGYTRSHDGFSSPGSHQSSFGGASYDGFLTKFNPQGFRVWGTYYGGANPDEVRDMALDKHGNVYITGHSSSQNGISTPGMHKPVFSGGNNAFLAMFNPQGQRLWGTYYGGGDDFGRCIKVDADGNIYMAGITSSTDSIATPGTHQPTNGGGADAFLVKFNPQGQRLWGTYFGGRGSEEPMEMALDAQGNIFLLGNTSSPSGIASAGSYQTTHGGGIYDAFLAKFSPAGQRVWSTYYGGPDNDFLHGIARDADENIYLAGFTESNSGIATAGSHQTIHAGTQPDAFLVKLNAQGQRQWGTYFGGSGIDMGFSVAVDEVGYVYLMGNSGSTSGIATANNPQQATYGGGYNDTYLACFDGQGQRLWSTYFGSTENDYMFSSHMDRNGVIYTSGTTYSQTGIATPGSYQTTITGSGGIFMSKWGAYVTATKTGMATRLSVRPNPAGNTINITPSNSAPIQLIAPNGKGLQTVPAQKGGSIRIDLTPYPAGLYLIRQGTAMQRVMKE